MDLISPLHSIFPRGIGHAPVQERCDEDDPMRPARGLILGLAIGLAFWFCAGAAVLMLWRA